MAVVNSVAAGSVGAEPPAALETFAHSSFHVRTAPDFR